MAVSKELSQFTRDALAAGKSRVEIGEALGSAGWSGSEVHDALDAWADTPFSPPVPRPRLTVSARDFFVHALMFGVLLVGSIHLVQLFHALIDLFLQDNGYFSHGGIRRAMAVLIVATPLYLWLSVRERGKLAADPSLYRSAVRLWLTYLTLLAAAAILLGDLMMVIYAFLSGDFTVQFVLKATVVAVVAGLIFLYYMADLRKGDAS